jgi:hypothetical protein
LVGTFSLRILAVVIGKVGECVNPLGPEDSLQKTEPAIHLVHPAFDDEHFHLVEHCVAVLQTSCDRNTVTVVRMVDLIDVERFEFFPVDGNDGENFFCCH